HADALGCEGAGLAGSGQPGAVAGADGGAVTADLLRAQRRESRLQRLGIRGGQRAGQQVAVPGRRGLALEGGQRLRRGGDQLERAGRAVVADARLEGVVAQGHGGLRSGWVRDTRCPGGRIAVYRKRLHRCRLQGSCPLGYSLNEGAKVAESSCGVSAHRSEASMAVTLKDVARQAGVSVATASRAFQRPEMVGARSLARVREAAAELGYAPNRTA